jgi:hypothetical protein
MDLPKKERTFYFDFTTELGQKYDGNFTIKCKLNVAETHLYELERSRLLGDQANPTNGLYNIAFALGFLRSRVIDGPQWWIQKGGSDLEDEEVLYELVAKTNEEIKKWKDELIKIARPGTDLGK